MFIGVCLYACLPKCHPGMNGPGLDVGNHLLERTFVWKWRVLMVTYRNEGYPGWIASNQQAYFSLRSSLTLKRNVKVAIQAARS